MPSLPNARLQPKRKGPFVEELALGEIADFDGDMVEHFRRGYRLTQSARS